MSSPKKEQRQAEFGAALDELFRAVLRATGRGVPGGETELTLSQFNMLSALGEGPATVTEVAAAADVAAPTATRALRALQERGFVERTQNAGGDGRHVTVALTSEGSKVLAEKTDWVRARQRAIFDGLTEAQRRTAAATLRAITEDIHEL
ncbi:MAG: MarR family winged helix-turn-helix transcriptional regulator [Thermoleophilaceae bacterium]